MYLQIESKTYGHLKCIRKLIERFT